MSSYIKQILTLFKNKTLVKGGFGGRIYRLLQDGHVEKAIALFQDNDEDVDRALSEYNAELHKVMYRPNKRRKKRPTYISEKLPRSRQDYINEVELFFLLGNPIIWKKKEGDDEAYSIFLDFIEDQYFHDNLCEAKRLAGAETESAKLYRITQKGGRVNVRTVILSRSNGYKLRPMFDQYGKLQAFAYGYKLVEEDGRSVQHWDIETEDFLFYCKRSDTGWSIDTYENPTGKINIIFYKQRKSWHGVQQRIDREEMLDSKTADTNNYFADPMAKATADVINNLASPETIGGLIQMTGSGSQFEYVNPPQSSESRESEKKSLKDSILFDTYTPDLSYENLRGIGSLSGVAIKNAMAIGYIKRKRNIGIYKQLVRRDYNLIVEILCLMHPSKADALRSMKVTFDFAEPFDMDNATTQRHYADLYNSGVLSIEEAVANISIADNPQEEIERIKALKKQD